MKNESVFSTTFVLCPKEDATLPAFEGHLSQASFLKLISEFDGVLSRRLHNEPYYRPYTVSTIRGGKISGDTMMLRQGQTCYLRVTLLDGGILWDALQTYFLEAGPISLRLGNTDFQLMRMLITPTTNQTSWTGSADWQTLATLPVLSKIRPESLHRVVYLSTEHRSILGCAADLASGLSPLLRRRL